MIGSHLLMKGLVSLRLFVAASRPELALLLHVFGNSISLLLRFPLFSKLRQLLSNRFIAHHFTLSAQ